MVEIDHWFRMTDKVMHIRGTQEDEEKSTYFEDDDAERSALVPLGMVAFGVPE